MIVKKANLLKHSMSMLLAIVMCLSAFNICVSAETDSNRSIEDGVTYTAPITVGYQMEGYESYQCGKAGLLGSSAEIKAEGNKLTVTVTGSHDGSDYLTGLNYKDYTTDESYKPATILEKDANGNVAKAQFTVPYTESYIYISLEYTSQQAEYGAALGIDFSNAVKKDNSGEFEKPDTDSEATHTIRLTTGYTKMVNGKYFRESDVIKIPGVDNENNDNVTTGFIESAIGDYAEEAGLVEKDGKYTLILQMSKQGMMGATFRDIHLVHVDLDNIDAQTHELLTPVEKTVNGSEILEYRISLGTKEHLNDPIFMWGIADINFAGQDMSYYNLTALVPDTNYLVDLSQEKMPEDGYYTATINHVNSSGTNFDSKLLSKEVEIKVKDGKATILTEFTSDYTSTSGNSYAIYGRDTNYQSISAQTVPVSGKSANYVLVNTDDLRKVLCILNRSGASIDCNGFNIRVDMDTLKKVDSVKSFSFLDDGNYTADVEILNENGTVDNSLANYFETTNVPVKAENGKMTLSLRMTKNGLDTFKQNVYEDYNDLTVTPISGTDLNMVDFNLYYSEDTATLKANNGDKEITFKVRIKDNSAKKIADVSLLKDGNYTVDISCLKDTSNDISMSGNYFDKTSVPVEVKDGKIYMTLSIKTASDDGTMTNLIKGLKHKYNGNWIDDNPQEVASPADGIPRVSSKIQIESLEDPTYVQVYVTAMGWWATLRVVPDLNSLKGDNLSNMLAVPEAKSDPDTYTGMHKNDEVVNVTLSTTENDADIYYTVDGSAPVVGTAKTFKYNGAIKIKSQSEDINTVTIKAITYKDGSKSFAKSYDVIFLAKEQDVVISAKEPGVYSVPYRIRKAFENDYSMADDAVDGNMIVQVYKDSDGNLKSNYYMAVKARTQNNITGHLLQLWNIPGNDAPTGSPADYELDSQKSTVLTTVNEDGLGGKTDYPRLLKFSRDSSGEESFYIRVDVDAMGETHQSAKIVMDWDKAEKSSLPNGVYSVPYTINKAFEQDKSMANDVVNGPATVEINNGSSVYTLPVKSRNQNGIIGHLLNLWNIPGTDAPTGSPSDYEVDSQLAKITKTVKEEGINGTVDTFGSEFQFTRNSTGEDYFYIRVDVDAMGEDHQSAKLVPDWANAVWVSEVKNKVSTPELTAGGEFKDSKDVSITCDTENATIYYTIDGSEPSANNGKIYTGTITIKETTTVKAIAIKNGLENSSVSSATYIKVKEDNNNPTPTVVDVTKAGRYTIDAQLWHAYSNQPSMGNVAFKDEIDLLISDGKGNYTLNVATRPVLVSGYTTAVTDMQLADRTPVTVVEQGKFTTNTKFDGSEHELTYNKVFSIKVEKGQEYVDMRMKVPYTPMDAVGAATDGWLNSRLKIDWDSVVKVADDYTLNPKTTIDETGVALDYIDSKTGVKVRAEKGVFDENIQVSVSEIANGADFDLASKALDGTASKFNLYNVNFLDKAGSDVEPNGTVTLSFPVSKDYNSANIALYRINADGTKTVVKGTYADGLYTVVTKAGGSYAVADTTKQEEPTKPTEEPTQPTEPQPTTPSQDNTQPTTQAPNNSNAGSNTNNTQNTTAGNNTSNNTSSEGKVGTVKTGDTSSAMIYFAVMLSACAVLAVVSVKRKGKN